MKQFIKLPKLVPGDAVGIISPSAGLPGMFPWVQDLGLKRLKDTFGLIPKEYPTTRQMGSSLQDRANDIMAAFSDPETKAVFASIGGHDQIKLIKLLDPKIFLNNPKPFFGFSDNTHLHNFLWGLGIPSYYGGHIMTEFGFQNEMPAMTVESLNNALFNSGEYALNTSETFNDIGLPWSDSSNLTKQRTFEPNEGIFWDGNKNTEGILWGGCVESLILQCSTNLHLPSDTDLQGTILFIETAEDIPEPWIIEYLLTGFGERGWLNIFRAVLVGRPKAWEFDKPNTSKQKTIYKKEQRDIVTKTIREYNADIPIVQNLDFGHTAPQNVIPYGGLVKVNSVEQIITLNY